MGETIGSIDVELTARLAKFKSDLASGTDAVTRETKAMSRSFREQTAEARGALALTSEETGVTIPRHLRNLIATSPGAGAALPAASTPATASGRIGVIS